MWKGSGGTKSIDSGLAVESKGSARFENKETEDQMTTEDQLAARDKAKGGKGLNLFVPAVLQRVSRVVDGGSWCWCVPGRVECGRSSRRAALVSKSGRGGREAALGLVVADATPDQGSSNSEIVGPGSWDLDPCLATV